MHRGILGGGLWSALRQDIGCLCAPSRDRARTGPGQGRDGPGHARGPRLDVIQLGPSWGIGGTGSGGPLVAKTSGSRCTGRGRRTGSRSRSPNRSRTRRPAGADSAVGRCRAWTGRARAVERGIPASVHPPQARFSVNPTRSGVSRAHRGIPGISVHLARREFTTPVRARAPRRPGPRTPAAPVRAARPVPPPPPYEPGPPVSPPPYAQAPRPLTPRRTPKASGRRPARPRARPSPGRRRAWRPTPRGRRTARSTGRPG